ncbi:unnamed protein product [Cochlearia groenlandica]
MSKLVEWSDLPEELIGLVAQRLSSNVDVLCIRSVCKQWRSAVAASNRFSNPFKRKLTCFKRRKAELSPTIYCRVSVPCCDKGWLVKTRQDSASTKINLLSPLSQKRISPFSKTLNLLEFEVKEIQHSYNIQCSSKQNQLTSKRYTRVVYVDDNMCLVVANSEIWCCKKGDRAWKQIKNEQVEYFSDVIVHKGLIYALDEFQGAVWLIISLHELGIYQHRPSSIRYHNGYSKDKRLIEYDGDLCIVYSFYHFYPYNRLDNESTAGFMVFKYDEELVKWVEIRCLGDKAFVIGDDCCFSVLATDFHGCLEDSIYFMDKQRTDQDNDYEIAKVFKLLDGSITTNNLVDSFFQSCFDMFSPPFL